MPEDGATLHSRLGGPLLVCAVPPSKTGLLLDSAVLGSLEAQLLPPGIRFGILRDSFRAIANYNCRDRALPCALFGAVIERTYADREQRAYEEVLHKFDEMLTRQYHRTGVGQRGMVIHDRHVAERDIQGWATRWRRAAGRIGVLNNLSDVPLFAESTASRLLQGADFVSWALWRYYGLTAPDTEWVDPLWPLFHAADGVMHGLIHVNPGFRAGACQCPPCASRAPATAEAVLDQVEP